MHAHMRAHDRYLARLRRARSMRPRSHAMATLELLEDVVRQKIEKERWTYQKLLTIIVPKNKGIQCSFLGEVLWHQEHSKDL